VNAADQRTLTPWLGVLCVVLAAALVLLLAGIGRGVQWDTPADSAALPAAGSRAAAAVAPPLQHYAEVWQRPLFNVDRRPQPESGGDDADVTLGDLQLTGIILTPDLRMALLRDRNSGREVRVREGGQLPSGGWTLQALKPRSAVFAGNGQRTELPLTVAAHIDGERGADDAGKSGTYTPPPPAATPVLQRVAPPAGHKPAARKPDATLRPPASSAPPAQDPAAGAAQKARIQALKQSIEQRRRQQAAHDGARS
jgi:general secretion pathway protein N